MLPRAAADNELAIFRKPTFLYFSMISMQLFKFMKKKAVSGWAKFQVIMSIKSICLPPISLQQSDPKQDKVIANQT